MQENIVAHPELAAQGREKIEWVRRNMPVLRHIEEDFRTHQYFRGLRMVVCIHLEAKTAYLAELFAAGGAEVAVTGSNPSSTKDDVVAALHKAGLKIYAMHGSSVDELHQYMNYALDIKPHIIIDDGGDIVETLHTTRQELLEGVYGACEETTTGVLRALERADADQLRFPIMLVNNAQCKYLLDNFHGTGQSTWEGIMRSTNLSICGRTVVIIGYGWCGQGCALRARGLGAEVIVCEIDPIKAIDALLHGYRVMPIAEAAKVGDIFLTATGQPKVIDGSCFQEMKDGAILANTGHFKRELNLEALQSQARTVKKLRPQVTGYELKSGKWLYLLGEGDLVNISCGDGHPAEIMDTSFALQALCARYLAARQTNQNSPLAAAAHPVPQEIDREVAELALRSRGVQIDEPPAGSGAH